MPKVSINLLPSEFRIEELKRARFYKIQAVGIAVIILMVFLASMAVALRILQSQYLVKIQIRLEAAEERVAALKDIQGSLLLLKNRLTVVNKYLETPSERVLMYKLIHRLLPASVSVNSISIGREGEILVLATAADGTVLDQIFTNLTFKETNEDKIKEVSLENLSRGRDGVYRVNFKVKPR